MPEAASPLLPYCLLTPVRYPPLVREEHLPLASCRSSASRPLPHATASPGATARARHWVGLLVGGVFLSGILFFGSGCMLYYEEEGRGIHVPEPETASIPVWPDTPFAITYRWDGLNYAFNNVWLVVDEGVTGTGAFEIRGKVQCSDGTPREIKTGLLDGDVHEREDRPGGRFSAWIYLEDEYRRSSSTPITCSGVLHPISGTWTAARIVVTQRQRPSDLLAF